MAIVVTCPNCPTKLSAPDDAAGKAVRCPKCGAAAPVPALIPAEEVPVVDATPLPPKPKPKPVVAEAADDERLRKTTRRDDEDADEAPRKRARRDDDEEEERPRKKKKRYADDDDDYDFDHPRRKPRPNKSAGGAMLAVIIVGGVLLLVGLGVGAYFLAGKGSPFAKKAPVPKGWEAYSNADAGVKMYVPKKPSEAIFPVNRLGIGGGFPGGANVQDAEMLSVIRSGVTGDPVRVEVFVIRFRNSVPSSLRDKIFNNPDTPAGGENRTVRWLGRDALEQTRADGVARAACFDKVVVVAAVSGRGGRATKAEEDGFFDNFELTK